MVGPSFLASTSDGAEGASVAGHYLVTVATVEVGIANDLFNEFVDEVILTDLLASWIGDVASCVAKRDPPIPVDFVPDKPLAGCASFVPERSTEERSFVIIGIVEANMRSRCVCCCWRTTRQPYVGTRKFEGTVKELWYITVYIAKKMT